MTACTGSGVVTGSAAAQPVPVSTADPFYTAPADLAEHANGAVLRSREIVPVGLIGAPPTRAWQVQYRSSDGAGLPTTVVATIAVPTTPWTEPGPRPLLGLQIAEDSLGPQCAPSHYLRMGLAAGINNSTFSTTEAASALRRNWAVVISDYEGPRARFLDAGQTAHGVLDGLRATRSFAPAGLADSPIATIGYSGGAIATAWAAQQQPSYAPELELAGVALGGVPADLPSAIAKVNRGSNAGLGLLLLAAFHRLAPEADIPALLNDRGRRMLAENANACGLEFVVKYLFANIDDYTAATNIGADPRIRAIGETTRLDRTTPTAPIYLWHSTDDDVLPAERTDALVDTWCATGGRITYVRPHGQNHVAASPAGYPAAMDYLAQRFTGAIPPTGCA
ncbi:lipase family protein [Nocardia sp. NPDC052566]|uniref:lipase family protein n=1 Tax=Nocardia sp. NPDC052566 TaxID=3364330 RepID=UPI0037C8EF8C